MTQKEIGGRVFEFRKLPAAKAVPVGWKLVPLIPSLIKMSAGLQKQGADELAAARAKAEPAQQSDGEAVSAALAKMADDINLDALIGALTSKISGTDLVEMMRTTFESVFILQGQAQLPLDMDVHFGDGLNMDLFKVFAEALKVNFSGFFSGSPSGSSTGPAAQA